LLKLLVTIFQQYRCIHYH